MAIDRAGERFGFFAGRTGGHVGRSMMAGQRRPSALPKVREAATTLATLARYLLGLRSQLEVAETFRGASK